MNGGKTTSLKFNCPVEVADCDEFLFDSWRQSWSMVNPLTSQQSDNALTWENVDI